MKVELPLINFQITPQEDIASSASIPTYSPITSPTSTLPPHVEQTILAHHPPPDTSSESDPLRLHNASATIRKMLMSEEPDSLILPSNDVCWDIPLGRTERDPGEDGFQVPGTGKGRYFRPDTHFRYTVEHLVTPRSSRHNSSNGVNNLEKDPELNADENRIMNIFNRSEPLQPVTLSYEEIVEYEEAFRMVDKDNDGTIDVNELGSLLETVGLRPSEAEITAMIDSVDMNKDKVLNICEFIRLMSKHHNPFITPLSQFRSVFRVFDQDNTGYLTIVELKDLLFSLGQRCSEEELQALMTYLDRDHSGKISEGEFLRFFTTTNYQWLQTCRRMDIPRCSP